MFKKLLKAALGAALVFTSVIPTQVLSVFAATESNEQVLTIPVSKTDGETNKFFFAPDRWDGFNDPTHRWSKRPDTQHPEATYYEVKFRGNKIDIYAGGNHPMGEVAYYIDGKFISKHDLYLSSNNNERKVTTISGLEEGVEHTLKAQATGQGRGSQKLIDAGKVVVYHEPYAITNATIENTSMNLTEGAVQKIDVTNIQPSYATLEDLNFISNGTDIATVTKDGTVTANNEGQTTITVSAKNGEFSKTITVDVKPGVPNLSASIVDTDTQYTQKRFNEVKDLGLRNKTLSAWKNDKALSEFIIVSKGTILKDVSVTTSNLVNGDEVIPAENVKATYIKSTKAYNGGFLGYGSKTRQVPTETTTNRSESNDILYADASTKMNIDANKVQPVWVEFNIPANAKAGTYTTTLTVNAKGLTEPVVFNYTINVQNADLPNASEFGKTFDIELWQYPYSVAEYYDVVPFSDEHFKILEPHMELYKSLGGHAITTTINEDAWAGQTYSKTGPNGIHYPSMIKWEKKNGEMTYDYTNFDKWVNFNKKLGIGDKIVIYSIAPWHNSFTYWENDRLVTEPFANNANYEKMWKHFLNDLIKHLESKGWFEDSYIGIDERGFSKQAFDLIDSVTSSTAKPLKTAGAMDHFVNKYDLALRVTDLNVGDSAAAANPEQFTQLLKDREAKGYRTTLYSCTEHVPGNFSLSAPAESYWSIINAGEETSGFLRWAYDAWVKDPLNDATHNAFEPGDCFLVYPGDKVQGQIPQPRSSVRLEKMAEGVRDVNKLKLIEKEVPTLKGEIEAIYDSLEFTAYSRSGGHYLTESELATVIRDTTRFKSSVESITNTYNDYKATASKDVTSIEITNKVSEIALGSSLTLNTTVTPEKVLDNRINWQSNKPKIVSVDNSGKITANKVGTVTITASSVSNENVKDSFTLTVKAPQVDETARVAYYSFDNNNADDAWGTRNGTVNSNAQFKAGKSGNALYIENASRDGAVVLNGDKTVNDKGAWTVSYWVKANGPMDKRISVLADSTKNFQLSLRLDPSNTRRFGGLRVGPNDGDVLSYPLPTASQTFEANKWYNIAWTQDTRAGLTMYVDGKKVSSNAWTTNHNFKAPLDIIGAEGFTGYIDEVKLYNKVLSESEINADMLTKGLNIIEKEKTLFIGDSYEIDTNLISDQADKTIVFETNNPEVASVDQDGMVVAHKRGTAKITVKNVASGYTDVVTITVQKELTLQNKLPKYDLDSEHLSTIERKPGTDRQYLGQPDMIRTRTGRLITAYPVGHGHGPIVMQISDNNGESWTEKTDTPTSWRNSQETPTLYTLNMADGSERLMMITACPGWGTDHAGNRYGWNTSYSDDNGKTWTEYEHFYTQFSNGQDNPVVVGMASLIQLKDKEGNYIQKWMGVYHEQTGFVNYKTYLTFDDQGNQHWTEPVPYLAEHRAIEQRNQMCEIGMFRSPDGKRILGLARSQSHNNLSTLIYSDDEGETWSEPMDLQGALAGERHKAVYDPISGRLVITFREIRYDLNGNNRFDGGNDWRAGDWVAWVGTYEDLLEQNEGDYMITLSRDYAKNRYGGDTGYAGVVVLEDGTFIMDSYGHWDNDFSSSWRDPSTGSYNVKTDLCYIKQAKFKLSDVENANGLVKYDDLNTYINKVANTKADGYTAESFKAFTTALTAAQKVNSEKASQQVQVNKALADLTKAYEGLTEEKTNVNVEALSLSLAENIGVNFYLNISSDVLADANAKVVFTREDKTTVTFTMAQVKASAKVVEGKTLYRLSVPMAARQMMDVISGKVILGNQTEIELVSTSVQDYAKVILENKDNKYSAQAVAAVKAMLNYGTAAQMNFKNKVDQPANAILSEEDRNVVVDDKVFSEYSMAKSGSVTGLDYFGTSVLLKSKTGFAHYFTLTEGNIADYTFTVNGKEVQPQMKDGKYFVEFSDIYAKNLSESYELVITKDNERMSITFGVFAYANVVVKGNYSDELKAVVRSMYPYYQAALAYSNTVK